MALAARLHAADNPGVDRGRTWGREASMARYVEVGRYVRTYVRTGRCYKLGLGMHENQVTYGSHQSRRSSTRRV